MQNCEHCMEAAEIVVKLILLTTIFIDAALFAFVAQKKKKGIIYILLLIHLGGILGWSMSILMLLMGEGQFWAYNCFAFPIILALSKFLFVLGFPENKLPTRSWQYLLIIPTIILLPLSFVPGAFFTHFSIIDGYYIQAENGKYAFLYAIYIAYLLIYPIIVLARKYYSDAYQSHTKQQIKYLFVGTSIFFVVGLLTNSILPVFFDIYFFNGLGPSFSLVLAALIIYIIFRHQFLEVRKAIQRGFIFTVLLTCVIGLYIGTLTLVGMMMQQLTETAILLSAGITTVIGIFTVPHIDIMLRKKTDIFFFKHRYNYADVLYTLSEEINKSLEVDDISALTERSLKNIFKTEIVLVRVVHSEQRDLMYPEDDAQTVTIPITLNNKLIGTITLGEKQSGDLYTQEDIVLARTFSHQIAVAFEKARLYEEVKVYSKELENRVAERTQEIVRLQEAQTHMMLDIAHKLQNPLTILKSEIEKLQKSASHPNELNFFEKTIDDTSAFIYDLLHLARLEVNADVYESINVSDHLTELSEYFGVMAEQRGIRFDTHIQPDIMFICDKEKLTELITNLVSNAMKYCAVPKRDPHVSLSLTADTAAIQLSVTDNGVGIPANELRYIFNRFYRTKNTNAIQGNGLGLAICKKIVELHNGTIHAESVEGHGTTFLISFPRTPHIS